MIFIFFKFHTDPEVSALAIDLIRKRIHEPDLPPQRVTLPVSLVCRESCV